MASIFTKIINGEISAEIIYQDTDSIAILDVEPLAPGHTLVIPKKEVSDILGLDDDSTQALFLTVKRITGILQKAFQPEGFTIGINQGPASRGGVDHMHVHIVPRWMNDHGKSIHDLVKNPPQQSIQEIAKKIRSAIN
jgi:histidine triad (HIT) family protein